MTPKLQRILHPLATCRALRVEKFLQTESIKYQSVIDTKRRALDEEIGRLTVAHNAKFAGGNVSAPGDLERKLMPVRLDYLRSVMQARIDIRKRLGRECADLLLAEKLDKLEAEMIRTVDNFRLARDDDYKRRVAASGIPEPRSLYRDDAEYGDVVALIRQEPGSCSSDTSWSEEDTRGSGVGGTRSRVGARSNHCFRYYLGDSRGNGARGAPLGGAE